MVVTVTDVLNHLNEMGVFSYILPGLLVFAIVFALLEKTKVLGENKGAHLIISLSIALLSLQFDAVPTFFATIFPRFGIGLAIFLILLILIGFFYDQEGIDKLSWIGYIVGIGVAVWAITSWNYWFETYDSFFGEGGWLYEYFWPLIILAGLIALVVAIVKGEETESEEERRNRKKNNRKKHHS